MTFAATAIIGTGISGLTSLYSISESERQKKQSKKIMREEKEEGIKQDKIMAVQNQRDQSRKRRSELESANKGSGARATNITGSRSNTLG